MNRSQPTDKYASDAGTWLIWAENTYAGALELFRADSPSLWFPAALLGHQALEMYLKAALIRAGHTIGPSAKAWGHDLVALANELADSAPAFPSAIQDDLQTFTDFFNELRYPMELNAVKGLGQEHGGLLVELVERIRPLAEKDLT
jgi:HEPN domain-containing protein